MRFKLNHQSTRLMPGEKDHSVWVGDLTPDVDDLSLFKFFSARFQSVKSAKGTSDLNMRGQHVFLADLGKGVGDVRLILKLLLNILQGHKQVLSWYSVNMQFRVVNRLIIMDLEDMI